MFIYIGFRKKSRGGVLYSTVLYISEDLYQNVTDI
jgi:hypothetical protein